IAYEVDGFAYLVIEVLPVAEGQLDLEVGLVLGKLAAMACGGGAFVHDGGGETGAGVVGVHVFGGAAFLPDLAVDGQVGEIAGAAGGVVELHVEVHVRGVLRCDPLVGDTALQDGQANREAVGLDVLGAEFFLDRVGGLVFSFRVGGVLGGCVPVFLG